jgi:hypothetical protein
MGIDCSVEYSDGKSAKELFFNNSHDPHNHIGLAIESVNKGMELSVKTRYEIYKLIEGATGTYLPERYDTAYPYWDRANFEEMLQNVVEDGLDAFMIKTFLQFLLKHDLRLKMW